jgi:hypothetical protein
VNNRSITTRQHAPFAQHDTATAHIIFDPNHYSNITCSEARIQTTVLSLSPAEFQQAMNSIFIACGKFLVNR